MPSNNHGKWYLASTEPTDEERNDANANGIDLFSYGYARRYGATHNEILDAKAKGINIEDYGYSRKHGATHNEILDAHSKGLDLNDYGYAKRFGATHKEVLEAHSKGIDLHDYNDVRDCDATHNEILDAHSKGLDLYEYAIAREQDVTHNEALEAHSKGLDLRYYNYARYSDATHNEILRVHSKGIDLHSYNDIIDYGITHNEILDAHSKDINLRDYGKARSSGSTHEQALIESAPNYSPWDSIFNKNASKQHLASTDDNFGISKREQSEMAARAIGEHLCESMENIFAPGGFKLQQHQHTISEFEKRFPDHPIHIEEDDDPYVSHKVGDWEGRYYNGPYIELHHKKYGPMEVINLQGSDGETHKLSQDEFRSDVEHFVKHDAQQYVDNEEYNGRSSSKWYLASPGGTCLGCGTPLSNRMDSYCPTCTDIMSQSNDLDYMQTNPNHPEARPFQKPHDFSGNE